MWSFYGSEVFVFLLRDIVEIGDITPWGNKKIKKKRRKGILWWKWRVSTLLSRAMSQGIGW